MMRRIFAALAVLALTSTYAFAGVELGGRTYPDRERNELRVQCEGLYILSLQSVTSIDEDVENESDQQSWYMLSMLPFTLKDCKAAGLV